MPIIINNLQKSKKIAESELALLEQALQTGVDGVNKSTAEVGVILVDNDYIQDLNLKYRGLDQPTDVLSFAMAEQVENTPQFMAEEEPELLGDIFISVEKAMEQAEDYGHSFVRELCYLGIHGLLHLLGYDHQSPEQAKEMREREEQILGQFSLGRLDT